MSQELIEKVAKKMFETHNNTVTWEYLNSKPDKHIADTYRKYAATAISAVLEFTL